MATRDDADDAYWERPLAEMLAARPCGEDVFDVELDGFGGITLGCATWVAARTCPDRIAHSIHAHFFRPVPLGRPARLAVERVRDGRRLALRRVRVLDGEKTCCELLASFTNEAPGPSYQEASPPAGLPDPDGIESDAADWRRRQGDEAPPRGPLEWRWIGIPWDPRETDPPSCYRGWVRPRRPLPDDPAIGAAALAFLADYHSHMPVARKIGGPWDPSGGTYTSLDQCVWIHREPVWDDWWLATSESDLAHGGRALTRRTLHDREGRLVATMVQEMLLAP